MAGSKRGVVSIEPPDESVFVRYHVDVWAEVAADGEVVSAVVDSDMLAEPLDVVRADGSPVPSEGRATAIEAAESGLWPSWDFGASPVVLTQPARGPERSR